MALGDDVPGGRHPYGSWPSPISIDEVLIAGVGLDAVACDGHDVVWLETRPEEDGRSTVVRRRGEVAEELTPAPATVRSRVNEYGGGAFDYRDGWLLWCDDRRRQLMVRTPDGDVRPVTEESSERWFGGVRVHPDTGWVTAVCEDHTGAGEARTSIVALALDGTTSARPVTLAEGSDFYACVEVGPGHRIAWMEWDHPAMPWDTTRVMTGRLELPGTDSAGAAVPRVVDVRCVDAGSAAGEVSCEYPVFAPDGRLIWMSDRDGYWQPWILGERPEPLTRVPADHAGPLWQLGNDVMAFPADDLLVTTRIVGGLQQIVAIPLDASGPERAVVDPARALVDPERVLVDAARVLVDAASVRSLAGSEGVVWACVDFVDRPSALIRIDPAAGAWDAARAAAASGPDPSAVSRPVQVTAQGPCGPVYAWHYPPRLEGVSAPEGEFPPLIVRTHGGPTAMAGPGLDLTTQYWTSRGIGVVFVNYSGSTGYGRAYRDRLRDRWGVVDVQDCVAVVEALVDRGLADPARVAIAGGSAGGYTTLQALVSTDVFAAGMSRYGIGDLETLARDTHKFESRYLDGLIGPWPEARSTYLERSPIHHLDRLRTPMLILQGLADAVVPPSQAHEMADAVRARHLPVAVVLFEGEGHGFRRLDSRRRALESELGFLSQLFGFTPADPIPHLPIENLPTEG